MIKKSISNVVLILRKINLLYVLLFLILVLLFFNLITTETDKRLYSFKIKNITRDLSLHSIKEAYIAKYDCNTEDNKRAIFSKLEVFQDSYIFGYKYKSELIEERDYSGETDSLKLAELYDGNPNCEFQNLEKWEANYWGGYKPIPKPYDK